MCNPKLLCLPPIVNTLRDLEMRFTWMGMVSWWYPLLFSLLKHTTLCLIDYQTRPRGYKTFSMLNSAEHGIYHANKC